MTFLDNFLHNNIFSLDSLIYLPAVHYYAGRQEVPRRLLPDDTDSGDNIISPHITYDLEDRPEKLTESLRTLSQVKKNNRK